MNQKRSQSVAEAKKKKTLQRQTLNLKFAISWYIYIKKKGWKDLSEGKYPSEGVLKVEKMIGLQKKVHPKGL